MISSNFRKHFKTDVIVLRTKLILFKPLGMFKPGGWKRCGFGGVAGFAVGAIAVTVTSWSRIKHMLGG